MFLSKLAVKCFRFINLFFRPLKLRNKVAIISRQSDEPTLDIKILDQHLNNRQIETVVLTHTLKKSITGLVSYAFHMMSQMYHIATSKVVIIDGYCILVSILPKKTGQEIIQMWHALGAIKKFGWQNADSPDGNGRDVAEVMCMHRNYDYVFAPSSITGEFFAEAFRTPQKKIVGYGLPRIDYLRTEDKELTARIAAEYPSCQNKINVLYVPTFRKNAELDLEKLISGFDFERMNLIVKKHFLDKGDYTWAEQAGAIVDNKYTSMEWLKNCTKVITDYSAIAFEAAVLDREIYIYQPDVSAYSNNVGLNVDLTAEAIGRYVCRSERELFDRLSEDYDIEAVKAFRSKYIEIDIDHCTEDICDLVSKLLAK